MLPTVSPTTSARRILPPVWGMRRMSAVLPPAVVYDANGKPL